MVFPASCVLLNRQWTMASPELSLIICLRIDGKGQKLEMSEEAGCKNPEDSKIPNLGAEV